MYWLAAAAAVIFVLKVAAARAAVPQLARVVMEEVLRVFMRDTAPFDANVLAKAFVNANESAAK